MSAFVTDLSNKVTEVEKTVDKQKFKTDQALKIQTWILEGWSEIDGLFEAHLKVENGQTRQKAENGFKNFKSAMKATVEKQLEDTLADFEQSEKDKLGSVSGAFFYKNIVNLYAQTKRNDQGVFEKKPGNYKFILKLSGPTIKMDEEMMLWLDERLTKRWKTDGKDKFLLYQHKTDAERAKAKGKGQA